MFHLPSRYDPGLWSWPCTFPSKVECRAVSERATLGRAVTVIRNHTHFKLIGVVACGHGRDERVMTPLDKALQRLAQLQREEAELRQFIAMYQQLEGSLPNSGDDDGGRVADRQLKGNEPANAANLSVENPPTRRRRGGFSGPTPKEIAGLMERVIRERGGPMSRGEIVDALERRDVEIPAQDKSRYIGTIAWRNKGTFVNIEGRGYWVRDAGAPLLIGDPIDAPSHRDLPEDSHDELFD